MIYTKCYGAHECYREHGSSLIFYHLNFSSLVEGFVPLYLAIFLVLWAVCQVLVTPSGYMTQMLVYISDWMLCVPGRLGYAITKFPCYLMSLGVC